jgi:transcription elongation factor Elf1
MKTKKEKRSYRYACPACTNVAFYSNNKEVGLIVVCQSCGKTIETQKQDYIKL